MLDLDYIDRVLDAVEPEAELLTAAWRSEIHDMLSTVLKAYAVKTMGVEPAPGATPMQQVVAWSSNYPKTDKTKQCGAQQANGFPCINSPWTPISKHCRKHSDVVQQNAIDELRDSFWRPFHEAMATPEINARAERLSAFIKTKRVGA